MLLQHMNAPGHERYRQLAAVTTVQRPVNYDAADVDVAGQLADVGVQGDLVVLSAGQRALAAAGQDAGQFERNTGPAQRREVGTAEARAADHYPRAPAFGVGHMVPSSDSAQSASDWSSTCRPARPGRPASSATVCGGRISPARCAPKGTLPSSIRIAASAVTVAVSSYVLVARSTATRLASRLVSSQTSCCSGWRPLSSAATAAIRSPASSAGSPVTLTSAPSLASTAGMLPVESKTLYQRISSRGSSRPSRSVSALRYG